MTGVGNKISAFTNLYFEEHSHQALNNSLTLNDNHELFLFSLMDKIVEHFAAVGELLKLSEKKDQLFLRNPIYVLLRSILSDVIIASWLLDDSDNDLENSEDVCNRKIIELKRDHIKFYLSYLQKLEGLGLLPQEEKIDEISIINSQYRHLLSEDIKADLNNKGIPRSTSIKDMLNSNNKKNPVLVQAYKCYHLFSKVEHTGEFTQMILQKTFEEQNPMTAYVESAINVIETVIKAFSSIYFRRPEYSEKILSFKILN
jgi:hypothetical protein